MFYEEPGMRIADHIENAEPVSEESRVYKARQTNGSFTAVHVFPFRITEEQLIYFNEQVELLGEALIEFRAAIPRVLSHGFTKSDSFPFIETEWIDGDPLAGSDVFTVDSVISLAEEVSRALAYCHKAGVVHGNINSNNIIWEEKKTRYVVTGFRFGLGSSGVYTKSGCVALIAPGQKQHLGSKQEDVQDVGKLLWQLLTGKMNWYQGDDIDGLYRQRLSAELTDETIENQKKIPAWFATCIYKAMGVDKEKNFENAVQLYGYILSHHKIPFQKKDWYRSKPQSFSVERKRISKKARFSSKNTQPRLRPVSLQQYIKRLRFVFDRNIALGLIVAVLLLGFSIYAQKKEQRPKTEVGKTRIPGAVEVGPSATANNKNAQMPIGKPIPDSIKKQPEIKNAPANKKTVVVPIVDSIPSSQQDSLTSNDLGSYKVRSKAYFHNEPEETTRRNAFIVHWNNAVLRPLKEEGEFVYIVFTNHFGQTSRGWLRKKDLIRQ